jgi:serine protease Do
MKGVQSSKLRKLLIFPLLSVLIFFIFINEGHTQTRDEFATVQQTSKAFTKIAKKVIPAVVFIKVEQTVENGRALTPFEFNNPFDLFNDDFFERFFGQRYPHMKRPWKYKQMGQGSGFIFSKNGQILTNHHVVGEADKIVVKLEDNREFEAKIVGTDPKSDVAIIKIKATDPLPVLPLGNSEALEVGEWVMAVGNPFGLSHTMTVGVVSAKGRTSVGITDYEDFIQTDAAINPGNSGGPLVNMNGEVVGINSAIFSRSGGYMGIGFAIPIDMVKIIKDQLIAKGSVARGYLGVMIQDLSDDLVKSFDLDDTNGVLIAEVTEDSPAEKAGIRRGDVVVEFAGKKVQNVGQFRNMVALTPPNSKVRVTINRDGNKRVLTLRLGEQDEKMTARATQTDIMKQLGFTVQNLTKELAKQFGYENLGGVLVSEVAPGSPAQFAGIRPGTLILEVNRQPVKTTEELLKALDASKNTQKVLLLVRDRHYTRYVTLPLG